MIPGMTKGDECSRNRLKRQEGTEDNAAPKVELEQGRAEHARHLDLERFHPADEGDDKQDRIDHPDNG